MKIKKVLSIDLDVIMGTCISLYNDLSSNGPRNYTWEKIRLLRNIEPHLSYDQDNYSILQGYIVKTLMANTEAKICLAVDHDNILNFLKDDFNLGTQFEITNLDAHHDIDYTKAEGPEEGELENDIVTVGNWVGYLDKYNLLSKYTWVNTPSSTLYSGKLKGLYNMMSLTQFFVLYELETFDYIFICQSPGWVPPKFDNLFINLIELVNAVSDYTHPILDSPYCPMREPKPLNLKDESILKGNSIP